MTSPPLADPDRCGALRADLLAAGYTADAVRRLWGAQADTAVGRGLVGPALAALAGRPEDALSTIARVFFLGLPTDVDAVGRAFPATGIDGLVGLRLVVVDEGEAVPGIVIRPQDVADDAGSAQWWIASDLDEAALAARAGRGDLPVDHVLGVGGASLTLAGLQLPTPAARVLDVGVGCGIQALRARRYAGQVIATDVSERALAFTAFTATLNDLSGVETRHGSLFAPVAGELFDRVVSNPPFVITPRVSGVPAYEYRDAGLAGDALVEAFVTGVGNVLAEGGTAQLLGNWEYRDDADGLDRVRSWVASSPVPLEAWVVERERLDPLAYAELWVRDGGTAPGTPEYAGLVQAWLTDFAERGVTSIGFGYLLLRRPAGGADPVLARYERIDGPLVGALGPHLADALAANDRLAGLDDDALSAAILVVAGDVTEARHHLPGVGDPSVIELRQGGGFARVIEVDPALAALVGACDGDLSVGALIGAIAELLEVSAVDLADDLLPRVRELVFSGFLSFG